MRVAALYRHPVKGFAPEACEVLPVEDGRIPGDRAFGFRFANAAAPDDAWGPKQEFVALANTPGLARLGVRYDPGRHRLRIVFPDGAVVEEDLDDEGRGRIAKAVEAFVLGLPVNPLSAHAGRLPLRLVGDGRSPRYHDNRDGRVSLHSRASLAVVAGHLGRPDLSEVRFRSNIVIEGTPPWEEQAWVGRTIRVGEVAFAVTDPLTRCMATHANPRTGERDLRVMQALLRAYPSEEPTFGVELAARNAGTIRVGDPVVIVPSEGSR